MDIGKSHQKNLIVAAAEAALRVHRPELFPPEPGRLDAVLKYAASRVYSRMSDHEHHPEQYPESAMVYFVACNEFVKIGVAVSVKDRIAGMQTGCPYPLKLLGAFRSHTPYEAEERLHEMFNDCHYRGEWFKLTESELLARIQNW